MSAETGSEKRWKEAPTILSIGFLPFDLDLVAIATPVLSLRSFVCLVIN